MVLTALGTGDAGDLRSPSAVTAPGIERCCDSTFDRFDVREMERSSVWDVEVSRRTILDLEWPETGSKVTTLGFGRRSFETSITCLYFTDFVVVNVGAIVVGRVTVAAIP